MTLGFVIAMLAGQAGVYGLCWLVLVPDSDS